MQDRTAAIRLCIAGAGIHFCEIVNAILAQDMIQVDPRSAVPLQEQIHAGFRELVVKGLLKSGDPVPTVGQLAEALLISPSIVTRAYREMAKLGFLEKDAKSFVISENAWRQSTESLIEALQNFLESIQKARSCGLEWSDLHAVLTRLNSKGDKDEKQEGASDVLQQLHFFTRSFIAGTTSCPYCRELLQGGNAVCCALCGTVHHEECWNEIRHCSVYGCKGKVPFGV